MKKNLNKGQLEAVETLEGPVLVVAGAGSGKTSVLTKRIANLIIEGKAFPGQVLAFTFTNKAAGEIKTRLEEMEIKDVWQIWSGTFHSVCSRILRKWAERLGYTKNFVIYDVSDQKALIKKVMAQLGVKSEFLTPTDMQRTISSHKNRSFDPYDGPEEKKKIYELYHMHMRTNNAMDFDDLINLTIELLEQNPDVQEYYHSKFKYIHVDEYQDTNVAQFKLITLLASDNNVFAVGDIDQSIYRWRGADISNIRNFEQDFKDAKTVVLEQNYRSNNNILKLANSVIKNNEGRINKELWSEKGEGEKVKYFCAYDEKEEANNIVKRIKELKDFKRGEMAILYRNNAQSRQVEEALVREGIQYKFCSGQKFYDRKEIKDMLAYLSLVFNVKDDIAFERIVNEPRRSIGKTTMEHLTNYARQEGISLLSAATVSADIEAIKPVAQRVLTAFAAMIHEISDMQTEVPAVEIFRKLLEHTQIIEKYKAQNTVEADSRIDNIMELEASIVEQGNELMLEEYITQVALRSDQDTVEDESESVQLMTIHTAKGLEFDIVFLIGMNDGVIPSVRAVTEEDIAEERRLCYVAITRARHMLFLSNSKRRFHNGRYENTIPSRFLGEMDKALVKTVGITSADDWHTHARKGTRFDGYSESSFMSGQSRVRTYGTKGYKTRGQKGGYSSKNSINIGPGRNETSTEILYEGDYGENDRVIHAAFGRGLVVEIRANIATVVFDDVGMKKLDIGMAPMKKDV